jgi:hypothetical protein
MLGKGHGLSTCALGMNEKLHKKVSPPFEGGVVGRIDYLIYTVFSFPTGVVDSLISSFPLLI